MGITDETYAAGYPAASAGKASPAFYLGLNGLSHFSWIFSTVFGCLLRSRIPNPEKWGLDFALPAMFIALLFIQLKNKKDILVALAAGVLSAALAFVMRDNFNIIAATVAAAFIGVCIEK